MHHNQEEYIGMDIGDKRIGLARGSNLAKIAQPLRTVPAKTAMHEIANLVKEYPVTGIVVGFPRNLKGEETGQTIKIREWVKEAKSQINLPFYRQDEALTSVAAQGDDARAAAIILQDFLDTPKSQRVRF